MARRYGEDVQFVGIPGRGEVQAMREFVKQFSLSDFPHVVDGDGSLWRRFGVPYQPAWVFIDDSGETSRHIGPLAESEVVRILEGMAAS